MKRQNFKRVLSFLTALGIAFSVPAADLTALRAFADEAAAEEAAEEAGAGEAAEEAGAGEAAEEADAGAEDAADKGGVFISDDELAAALEIVNGIEDAPADGLGSVETPVTEEQLSALELIFAYDDLVNKEKGIESAAVYSTGYDARAVAEYYYSQLTSDEKKFYEGLTKLCDEALYTEKDYSTTEIGSVTIPSTVSMDRARSIYKMFYYSNPQYYYFDKMHYAYGSGGGSSYVCPIISGSFLKGTARTVAKQKIDASVASIMADSEGYTDIVDKETWLVHKLCDITVYDLTAPHYQSMYGLIVDNACVCNGYALTTEYFLNNMGIPTVVVTNDGHAWNRVKLYDNWYSLDTTWVDQKTFYWDVWINKSSKTFEDGEPDHIPGGIWGTDFRLPVCLYDEVQVSAGDHTHTWTYTSSGSRINAVCGGDSSHSAYLDISAPAAPVLYDGTAKTASVSGWSGFADALAVPSAIVYKKDGAVISGAPTEAGEYTASVSAGGATAFVSYTIEDIADGIAVNAANFPDAKFLSYVSENIDADNDKKLSAEEIAAVTAINVYDMGISDLTGIGFFTALTELKCNYNRLVSIDVSKNTALTKLNCDQNRLTSLDVSKNTALTSLRLYENELKELDVSKNTALTELNCSLNDLQSLDVSKNIALQNLSCNLNRITKLDVSKNTALTELSCNNNKLVCLDVSKNTLLTKLYCSSNRTGIGDVVGSYDLAELAVFGFDPAKASGWKYAEYDSKTKSLKNFEGTTAIYQYDCGNGFSAEFVLDAASYTDDGEIAINEKNFPDPVFRSYVAAVFDKDANNKLSADEIKAAVKIDISLMTVSDLTGIEYFTELTDLDCSGCGVTKIDISKNTKLKTLKAGMKISSDYYFNRISSIDLSKNTALEYVDVSSNWIDKLDVSAAKKLKYLNCANNKLSSLSPGSALTYLNCSNNKLTSLDVSSCTALEVLDCSINRIASLDLGKNKSLTELSCSCNELSLLDLSANSLLVTLNCYSNKISSLNIKKNTVLSDVYCAANSLKSLDISSNSQLTSLRCGYNQLTSLDAKNCRKLTTFDCSGNAFFIGNVKTSYSLANLAEYGFDSSKASNWSGAAYDKSTNSLKKFTDREILYNYNCGNSIYATFRLIADDYSAEPDPVTDDVFTVTSGSGSVSCASWKEVLAVIEGAKNSSAVYTVSLNKSFDIGTAFKMPKAKTYSKFILDGNDNTLYFTGNISLTGAAEINDITLCALDRNGKETKFSITAGRNALSMKDVTADAAGSKLAASGEVSISGVDFNGAVSAGTLTLSGTNKFGGSVTAKKIAAAKSSVKVKLVKTAEKSDKTKFTVGAEGITGGTISLTLIDSFYGKDTNLKDAGAVEFGAWNAKAAYNGCISIGNSGSIETVQSGKKLFAVASGGLYVLKYTSPATGNTVTVKYLNMKDLSSAINDNAKIRTDNYSGVRYSVTLPAKDDSMSAFTLPASGKYGSITFSSAGTSEIKTNGDLKLTGNTSFGSGIKLVKCKSGAPGQLINLSVAGNGISVIFAEDIFGGKLNNVTSTGNRTSVMFSSADMTVNGKVSVKGILMGETFTLMNPKGGFTVGTADVYRIVYSSSMGRNVKINDVSGTLKIRLTDNSVKPKTVLAAKIGTFGSYAELSSYVTMTYGLYDTTLTGADVTVAKGKVTMK